MNRIKFLRKQKGWTQAQLGAALNVQNAAISKYENSLVGLTADILVRLSDIFSCSIDYILGNDKKIASTISKENISVDELSLLSDYRNLDISRQQILLGMVAFLRSPQSKGVGNVTQNSKGDNCFLAVGNGNHYVASGRD